MSISTYPYLRTLSSYVSSYVPTALLTQRKSTLAIFLSLFSSVDFSFSNAAVAAYHFLCLFENRVNISIMACYGDDSDVMGYDRRRTEL